MAFLLALHLLGQFGLLGRGISRGAAPNVVSIGAFDNVATGTTDIGAQ